jgi:hypothetical protein
MLPEAWMILLPRALRLLLALTLFSGLIPPLGAACEVPPDCASDGEQLAITQAVAGSARLTVVAKDITGRPVKARVIVHRLFAGGDNRFATGLTARDGGTFCLPPGGYRVEVVSPDGEVRAFDLDLENGQTRTLTVIFD